MKKFLMLMAFIALMLGAMLPASANPAKSYDDSDVAALKIKLPTGSKIHQWENRLKKAAIANNVLIGSSWKPILCHWSFPDYNDSTDRVVYYGSDELRKAQAVHHVILVGVLKQIASMPDAGLRKKAFKLLIQCDEEAYKKQRAWDWKRFRNAVQANAELANKLAFDGSTKLPVITAALPAAPASNPPASPSPSPPASGAPPTQPPAPAATPIPNETKVPVPPPASPAPAEQSGNKERKTISTPAPSGSPAGTVHQGAPDVPASGQAGIPTPTTQSESDGTPAAPASGTPTGAPAGNSGGTTNGASPGADQK